MPLPNSFFPLANKTSPLPDASDKLYKSSGGKMVYNTTLKRQIQVGWKDSTLDDLGQIVGGITPSTGNPESFTATGTPWLTSSDLSGNQGNKFTTRGVQDVSDKGSKDASLKKSPAETVLLSSRVPIGYMATARVELTINWTSKEVSAVVLETVKIALPDANVVDQFNIPVASIFKRPDSLEQENQQLTQLRDWLLPMLMNGQVTMT